jgi:hypothetical protein
VAAPLVVVQAGHCYRKTGSTGTSGEQVFTAAATRAAVAELERRGFRARGILADDPTSVYAGSAFVAIHCDGSTSPSARGASVGYRDAAGKALAVAWKTAYQRRGWSGGFRPDNYTAALAGYYGTGNAAAAGNGRAFILEAGFLTSPDDRALLGFAGSPPARANDTGIGRVAGAIADACEAVFGRQITSTPPTKEPDDMPLTAADAATVWDGIVKVPAALVGKLFARPQYKARDLLVGACQWARQANGTAQAALSAVAAQQTQVAALTDLLRAALQPGQLDAARVEALIDAAADRSAREVLDGLQVTFDTADDPAAPPAGG